MEAIGHDLDQPIPICGQLDLGPVPPMDPIACRLEQGHDGEHDDLDGRTWPHPD